MKHRTRQGSNKFVAVSLGKSQLETMLKFLVGGIVRSSSGLNFTESGFIHGVLNVGCSCSPNLR